MSDMEDVIAPIMGVDLGLEPSTTAYLDGNGVLLVVSREDAEVNFDHPFIAQALASAGYSKAGEPDPDNGWLPIDDKAKDGSMWLLAAHDIHGHNDEGGPRQIVRSGYWMPDARGGRGCWSSSAFTSHFPPTHYKPIGPPPRLPEVKTCF